MNNIHHDLLGAVDATMKWRRHLWEHHQMRDAPPSLGFIFDGEEGFRHVPAVGWETAAALAGPEITPMVEQILGYVTTWDDFTRFREIIFICESYGFDMADAEEGPTDLEKDFATNPETKVVEQMLVAVARDDLVGGCEVATARFAFRITDGGAIVFDEPVITGPEDPHDGDFINVLRKAILHDHT
jgi:hypothetical protein